MRILSFNSLSPKGVRTRPGNRHLTSLAPSEISGSFAAHPNHDAMNGLKFNNLTSHVIQRRTSRLSLHGLYPVSTHSSDIGAEETDEDEDELRVLEPRPKTGYCVGLFELIEARRTIL